MKKHLPDLYKGLTLIEASLGSDSFKDVLETVYKDLEPVSFDYGIMEKTEGQVFVVPIECGWSEVGSWESLYELRKTDYDKDNNLSEGDNYSY